MFLDHGNGPSVNMGLKIAKYILSCYYISSSDLCMVNGDIKSGANEGNFYDELFFCYNCKSIFVSEVALEEHQERMH